MSRKKWIIIAGGSGVILLSLLALVFGRLTLSNPWLDGEQEIAQRGDLVIPVTATGTVEANKIIQIKSKAGGQVSKIHVVEGQMVKKGEILVELDPVDENRNVEARQADLDRAKGGYEKTKIALDNQVLDLPLQTRSAEARLVDAEARLKDAEFKWNKMKEYLKQSVAGEVEGVTTEATYLTAKASRDLAETDLKRAKNNENILFKSAEQDVAQAEAAYRSTQKALDEAKQRLSETKVTARSEGMVFSILVREGEMIQSGTQTFTGGTLVMVLADVSAVFVMAKVDEADIGSIRKIAPEYARPGTTKKLSDEDYAKKAEEMVGTFKGKTVDVTVDAYRSQTFHGVIERILPEPQMVNNALAFNVRVRLVGDDLQKLVGHQSDLAFTTEKIEKVILVKNEALVSEGKECFVYVPVPKGPRRMGEKKVPVKIGATDGTNTEVIQGVKEGQAVWTKRPQQTEKEKQESQKS